MILFFNAVLIGAAIAAPLGPIGALCMRRTLASGFRAGVAGGLGTALADALYAALAASGFAALSDGLARVSVPLGLAGGAALLWLAWRGWPRAGLPGPSGGAPERVAGLRATVTVTFALTIANPATILSFTAIFAGLGLRGGAGSGIVVVGVFVGSMLWWIFLAASVALLRRRLPEGFARAVAQVSSLTMAGFGLWALASTVLRQ